MLSTNAQDVLLYQILYNSATNSLSHWLSTKETSYDTSIKELTDKKTSLEEYFRVNADSIVQRNGNDFIKTQIGNIYAKDFDLALVKRPCTNDSCGCHIGYVHMETLPLYETFGEGVLERIPKQMIWGGVV